MSVDPIRNLVRFAESGCLEVCGQVKEAVRVEVDGVGFRVVSMRYDAGRDVTSLQLEREPSLGIAGQPRRRRCPWLDGRA